MAGRFRGTPKGVILHGTRSGRAGNTIHQEYTGTVAYVARGTDGTTAWHVTGGEGEITEHMRVDEWGWNARAASDEYLGYEFAQAVESWDITDAQVEAFAWWFLYRVLPAWPDIPRHFPTHGEVEASGETGSYDGKTDCIRAGDPRADELRTRIMAWL